MKHISILAPNGNFSLTNLDLTRQMFSWVNENSPEPLFKIEVVGLQKEVNTHEGLYTINVDKLITEIDRTDVIVIPATFDHPETTISKNKQAIPWILNQYNFGADIVSMCVGAFFLASMGLLDGKRCSTHWGSAKDFKKLFPQVMLEDERIVSESERVYTSGGALAFSNLLVYLIEKYTNRELAIAAAKTFMIDIDRNSQSPFSIFSGQKSHDDKDILKAQDFIESHYKEKIAVDSLCKDLGIGRRTFERRFKYATSNTIVEYIQRVKIEAAKKSLESTNKTISEVMYQVGYNDTKAFRNVFKKYTGLTPIDYRNKYNKEAVFA